MKNAILPGLLLLGLFACQQAPKTAEPQTPPPAPAIPDSAAVADVIHNFYKWYDAFSRDETKGVDFTDDSGAHLKLNAAKLDAYFANFQNSGFVSAGFIEQEKAFYKKCEALWQKEPKDDVPSGMDADKYFCAQDWEVGFYTTAAVRLQPSGADRVTATLYSSNSNDPQDRRIELVRENGKWLIAKIECDMGVQ